MNVVNHFVPAVYAVATLKIYFDMVRGWQPEKKPIFLFRPIWAGLRKNKKRDSDISI